jgi:uncharacterized protein (TIGR02231 family)
MKQIDPVLGASAIPAPDRTPPWGTTAGAPSTTVGGPAIVLTAPIGAVTVYPDRARITRRGRVRLEPTPGDVAVVLDDLPLSIRPDSLRVSGAGNVTVLGVDLSRRYRPRTTDEVAVHLENQLRSARADLAALDDDLAVLTERLEFLSGLGRRATRTFATALAAGSTDPAGVSGFADALGSQQAAARQLIRDLTERRERATETVAARERDLDARRRQREPDRMTVQIVLGHGGTETEVVDLEVSYLVDGAGWSSSYDLRLTGDMLELSWYGLITQRSGEDWPECELSLSTARPGMAASVPDLDPWFLDRRAVPKSEAGVRYRQAAFGAQADDSGPPLPPMAMAMAAPAGAMAAPLREQQAGVEQGATAATYRPSRPIAVPADGGAHRTTVAVLRLEAELDYVTAPVRVAEARLRAIVTNATEHTLPAGFAAVFHDRDFVGSAALPVWAPGEEVDVALGVDDRIRVVRELVRRSASRAVVGQTRRQETEHRITVTNHTPRPARVTVLDQVPVSRDDAIVVKETRVDPAPAERGELGELTWVLELAPGESGEVHLGLRVELARGVEMAGWRE